MSRFGKSHGTEELIQPGYRPAAPPRIWVDPKHEEMKRLFDDMSTTAMIGGTTLGASTSTSASSKPLTFADIAAAIEKVNALAGKTMTTTPNKGLGDVSLMLNDIFKVNPGGPFSLTGPISASIKERNGAYKTKAFLGDEQFKPASTYVGKKGDLIVVFKASVPTQYAFMEMPLQKACDQLKSFGLHLDTITGGSIEKTMESFNQAVVATKAAESAALMADPNFASW